MKVSFYLVLVVSLSMGMACSKKTTSSGNAKNIVKNGPLKLGDTGVFDLPNSEKTLSLTFVRVAEDSRCPKGVQCIWPGKIDVVLQEKDGGEILVSSKKPGVIGNYSVSLKSALPYPEKEVKIAPKDYVIELEIGSPKEDLY